MHAQRKMIATIYYGWTAYQNSLVKAIAPLDAEQLALQAAPHLRSVHDLATHIIGARARWFYGFEDDGMDVFKPYRSWDRQGAETHNTAELVSGLEATWVGMNDSIERWTAEQWADTWPGEDDSEPETITRQWVIWHLIEHDIYHGGEISLTLGVHGVTALEL